MNYTKFMKSLNFRKQSRRFISSAKVQPLEFFGKITKNHYLCTLIFINLITMAIKNIIFDFGGVLVNWNPRYLLDNYLDNTEEMENLIQVICSPEWNHKLDLGYPFALAINELKDEFPKYKDIIQLSYDKWELMLGGDFPKTVALLYQLKKDGYKIYGLTNWSKDTFPIAYNKFPFFKEFDGIVVSGEERLGKPDPAFYKLLLDRYNLIAEESIFIDDRAVNVEAAENLNIHGIFFDSQDTIEEKVYNIITENRLHLI